MTQRPLASRGCKGREGRWRCHWQWGPRSSLVETVLRMGRHCTFWTHQKGQGRPSDGSPKPPLYSQCPLGQCSPQLRTT